MPSTNLEKVHTSPYRVKLDLLISNNFSSNLGSVFIIEFHVGPKVKNFNYVGLGTLSGNRNFHELK